MSSDMVRYTSLGWKNWSVYKDALGGKPNDPWNKAMEVVTAFGNTDQGWDDVKKHYSGVSDINKFIDVIRHEESFGKSIGKPNEFGLSDSQMAFVIMMAESGGVANAIGENK
jgi:hypothetical protein